MTGPDVADYAGITYRQLDHWCTQGWLHPDAPTPGSGNCRWFDADEVQVARWMAHLVRHGVTPAAASPIARELHHTGRARVGLFTIATATITHQGDTAA